MDGYHPKRRKDRENPYTLITAKDGRHWLSFTDGQGMARRFEIEDKLYHQLDSFELDDLVHLNEVDRHYEQSELTDSSLYDRAFHTPASVEEMVLQKLRDEQLHKAIQKLPDVQRRRLILYFFKNKTYKQIAEMEECSHPAVIKSVKSALETLKKYFQR